MANASRKPLFFEPCLPAGRRVEKYHKEVLDPPRLAVFGEAGKLEQE